MEKKYGIIGAVPDDTASLSGIFSLGDVNNLLEDSNWGGKVSVEYLLLVEVAEVLQLLEVAVVQVATEQEQ